MAEEMLAYNSYTSLYVRIANHHKWTSIELRNAVDRLLRGVIECEEDGDILVWIDKHY